MNNITRQSTDIVVDTTQVTATYVMNTVLQAFLRICSSRRLGPNYINENREILENGLFAWIVEQTLKTAYLEVFIDRQKEAMERWDFTFTYENRPEKPSCKPPIQELNALCTRLKVLPAGTKYRVVVQTAPGAIQVPGWEPTKLRELTDSSSCEFSGWAYGNVGVDVKYRGNISQ
jgi:hypothetical protein